ncbi:accessory gland-specific peptide 57Db [Drosophila ficusphila]|nr:accessory gland-specific peptide 57Db [Drosophila ficusphila]
MKFLTGFLVVLAAVALAKAEGPNTNDNKNVIHINPGGPAQL